MTDTNLITVDQFKLFAPEIDISRYTTETLESMIAWASKQVSDYLQYTPLAEDITDEIKEARVSSEGDLIIKPRKVPVQSVSSIILHKGATNVSLVLTDDSGNTRYNIDFTKRTIVYPYGEIAFQGVPVFANFFQLRRNLFYVKLSYRGGFEDEELPSPITQATVLFMRDIFSEKYNMTGADTLSQGGISLSFSSSTKDTSQLVKKAHKLLNPYRRI
jgi:hypothetical protein